MAEINYGQLEEITPRAVEELNSLIVQMSRDPRAIDEAYLVRVLAAPGTLIVARDGDRIVGCAQVSIQVLLSKVKGWVDEIVVDEGYRGHGIAGRLLQLSVDFARKAGCKHINLSSGDDRTSAHGLYEKSGFRPRNSVQYRRDLD
jgi:GNAT superfamily N-acetyltransferase